MSRTITLHLSADVRARLLALAASRPDAPPIKDEADLQHFVEDVIEKYMDVLTERPITIFESRKFSRHRTMEYMQLLFDETLASEERILELPRLSPIQEMPATTAQRQQDEIIAMKMIEALTTATHGYIRLTHNGELYDAEVEFDQPAGGQQTAAVRIAHITQ